MYEIPRITNKPFQISLFHFLMFLDFEKKNHKKTINSRDRNNEKKKNSGIIWNSRFYYNYKESN